MSACTGSATYIWCAIFCWPFICAETGRKTGPGERAMSNSFWRTEKDEHTTGIIVHIFLNVDIPRALARQSVVIRACLVLRIIFQDSILLTSFCLSLVCCSFPYRHSMRERLYDGLMRASRACGQCAWKNLHRSISLVLWSRGFWIYTSLGLWCVLFSQFFPHRNHALWDACIRLEHCIGWSSGSSCIEYFLLRHCVLRSRFLKFCDHA